MNMYIRTYSCITNQTASVNGLPLLVDITENDAFLTSLYRALKIDYAKFFKMDNLSKLGFLTAELIFKEETVRFEPREDIAVVCFNKSSSLDTDTKYQETIQRADNYFPSPSIFVYTLPNLVTGEIAIRNKLHGETSFYVLQQSDAEVMYRTVVNAFRDKNTRSVLLAWVEYFENVCETFMMLVDTDKVSERSFTLEQIKKLINNTNNHRECSHNIK